MVDILALLLIPTGLYLVAQACSRGPARIPLYLDLEPPQDSIRSMPLFYAVFVLYAIIVICAKVF
jgi:hypothetical protein